MQGRFFNGAEDQQRAHVCVIGSEAKTKLFSGGWAIGETIRLNGINFTVVGVYSPKMQEGDNDNRNRTIYIPFNTMSDLKDTHYIDGIWFNYRGDNEMVEKGLRETHGRGPPLQAIGPQRDFCGQSDDAACAVSHSGHCAAGAACRWSDRSRWALPASA